MNVPKVAGFITLICAALALSQTGKKAETGTNALRENDEYIHAILVLDRNVLENAKVLIHDLETKGVIRRETAGYHSTEMERSLNTSEAYLTRLEKETDIALDKMALSNLAGLHQHYVNAIAEQKELATELDKAKPEKSFIRMKTAVIYAEMKKAEAEHLKMDKELKILEPQAPAQGNNR